MSMQMTNGGMGGKERDSKATIGMAIMKDQETVTPNPPGILRDPTVPTARRMNTDIPNILPHERVFPIQIGSDLFRLSGASLSSDGMYLHLSSCERNMRLRNLEHPHTFPSFFNAS